MSWDIYQVDSFSDQVFGGNPAAVVPLQQWLSDELLQAIAGENNLSETAFFVREGEGFGLRWFTPQKEVALCGHATLAAAHVLFNHGDYISESCEQLVFQTLSGPLVVVKSALANGEQHLVMDFPAQPAVAKALPAAIAEALGATPQYSSMANNWLLRYASESEIKALSPDFSRLLAVSDRNVIVTAPGEDCDFVSRFFAPHVGINEDPVTGSAHCTLIPYWAQQLGKQQLLAEQVSKRGGVLQCRLEGKRVKIAGQCRTFMQGRLLLDEVDFK